MSGRLGEYTQILGSELIAVTSAATGLGLGYSMEDCEKITFVCGLGTVAGAATAITPTFSVRQSADKALSTNAVVTGATALVGPTTANQISNARSVDITMTTATTNAETITLMGYTLTQSTVGSATVATAITYGSSVGATAAEGLETRGNSLSSVINNSTLSFWMTASTISTAAVRITANDTASTGISAATTGTSQTITVDKQFSIIEVMAADLNSTSKYVGIGISSAATSVNCNVTVIKDGLRYLPPYQAAQAHKKST